jgi:hypothetical protein
MDVDPYVMPLRTLFGQVRLLPCISTTVSSHLSPDTLHLLTMPSDTKIRCTYPSLALHLGRTNADDVRSISPSSRQWRNHHLLPPFLQDGRPSVSPLNQSSNPSVTFFLMLMLIRCVSILPFLSSFPHRRIVGEVDLPPSSSRAAASGCSPLPPSERTSSPSCPRWEATSSVRHHRSPSSCDSSSGSRQTKDLPLVLCSFNVDLVAADIEVRIASPSPSLASFLFQL